MYKFTSPLTHRKLRQHKTCQIQNFEYSSISSIDAQFNEFCKQSRMELFSAKKPKKSIKFSLKAVSDDGNRIRKSQEGERPESGVKGGNIDFLNERVLDVYKNSKKTVNNLGVVNPVVDMFGNAVIAAFFQSLIIKTVEDVFQIDVDDPLSFSNQYLKTWWFFLLKFITLGFWKISGFRMDN